MKIAVWYNLPSGGGKRALYNHVLALQSCGHYLEAWTTDLSAESYLSLSRVIIEHSKPIKNELEKILKIRNPLKRERSKIKLLKIHSMDCIDEINRGCFDIVFANSCSITSVPFICYKSKIPVVLYLGEPDRKLFEAEGECNIWQLPEFSFSLKGIRRFYKDFLSNYSYRLSVREQIHAARSYSAIFVNSLYSRESVKRAYGLDSAVCYLGVNELIFSPNEALDKKSFVVGMGRISSAKSPETAISALSLISPDRRPSLIWISNDPVYDHLEKLVKFAVERKVDFKPLINIDDSEIVNVLSEASVMICTSRLEPFGLAPVEANMCGTAVIAVREGGFRESIVNNVNGFLVDDGNLSDMAGLIEKFCSDLKYSADMGKKAREYAITNWNFSAMADNIENALLKSVK